MRDGWRVYWAHMLHFLKLLPIGIPISLVPFAVDAARPDFDGSRLVRLGVSLTYGVVVPLAVWCWYAAVFALRTRTKRWVATPMAIHVLCMMGGVLSGIALTSLANEALYGVETRFPHFVASLVFGSFVTAFFTFYLAHRQAKEEALELRAVAAEASYLALEQQMRPHFLFNSLNSLAELIESGEERAATVAHTLSDLYRQILASSKTKTATLGSELEIARRYLELEQVRFGPRLTYTIDVPECARALEVPSLVVQTLVENAVKHGVAPSLDGGRVEVAVAEEEGGYRLSIANTGAPYRGEASGGSGLANTRKRLDLLYGDRHRFAIGTDGASRTVASFWFTGERIE
jgi:signal transduction histidine kinase